MNKRFKIERLIGRRWWLGKHLWELLDNHRFNWENDKFYAKRPLRLFNIGRKHKGWKMTSPLNYKW
jgi:hypothetical protein